MDWTGSVKAHLTAYKKNVLKIEGDGTFRGRPYGHILPCGAEDLNYMGNDALAVASSLKKHINRHHLNSSQTMCVNYFAPLLRDGGKALSDILSAALGVSVSKIAAYRFEYPLAAVRQSSEFDFWCRDDEGREFFFEIKYTEDGIAPSGGGRDPEKTYHDIYEPLVKKNPCFNGVSSDAFMNRHYQAYRNMVMANGDTGAYSVFITMAGNEKTSGDLADALGALADPANVRSLFWETLIPMTQAYFDGTSDDRCGYYREFGRKYLPGTEDL